jgi:hypothetical protein
VFAEAVRNPTLFSQVRRWWTPEIGDIQQRAGRRFSAQDAGCLLAFIIGSLVLAPFAPPQDRRFAAPGLRRFVAAMRAARVDGATIDSPAQARGSASAAVSIFSRSAIRARAFLSFAEGSVQRLAGHPLVRLPGPVPV